MKRHTSRPSTWRILNVPNAGAPAPLLVRQQTLPARHHFPEHSHDWHQLVYAISGALTVNTKGRSFVISPDRAVWLPANTLHQVGSLFGAEFRSLYVAKLPRLRVQREVAVFSVSLLLRALIIEAATLGGDLDDPYAKRVVMLILDQLERAQRVDFSLPWPSDPVLLKLCETLYIDPADDRSVENWGRSLGMSNRTLTRHFERDMGITLRNWRRRLRLFKSIEFLSSGRSVTNTAIDLGYASTSAFSFMFRQETGESPRAYLRNDDIRR